MIIKPAYPPGAVFSIRKMQLLEPCKLRIRRPDGSSYLIGMGVGETVEYYEPSPTFLVMTYKKLKEIPCPLEGVGIGTIIEWWDKFGNDLMVDATEVYEEFK